MTKYILAIDQGTTGSTAALVNQNGELLIKVNQEFPQIFPKPGWVEHKLEDIWASVEDSCKKMLKKAKERGLGEVEKHIVAIGITNQRETVGIWDRANSKPVHNAIVWQCRRTTDFCKKHKAEERWIRNRTGLVLDPYFSATKIHWLLKNVEGLKKKAREGSLAAGTIDSFLVWRLSGGEAHVTDVSNASRTLLMDLKTCQWDKELMDFFKIPSQLLPDIKSSSEVYAYTKSLSFLPDGIPISGMAGDQQAALFGQACFKVGEAKCTYGTGSFLLANTGDKPVKSKAGLLTTVAWKLKGDSKPTYALEGSAFICGAAVQWLRDQLQLIDHSSEIEALAKKVDTTEGVEFVPAFTGLGAPYWDPEARAVIKGLTRGSNRSHIARACLEGMALQNVDLLKAMEKDAGKRILMLKVDGGAAANDLLMQMQADFMGCRVVRPQNVETTALGAAFLAGLGVGLWKSKTEITKIWKKDREFQVEWSKAKRTQRLVSWHRAVLSAQT